MVTSHYQSDSKESINYQAGNILDSSHNSSMCQTLVQKESQTFKGNNTPLGLIFWKKVDFYYDPRWPPQPK